MAHKVDSQGCADGKIDFFSFHVHVISHLLHKAIPVSVISHSTARFHHVILRLRTIKRLQDALNPADILHREHVKFAPQVIMCWDGKKKVY